MVVAAQADPLPPRLQRLIEHLPTYDQIVDIATMGISIGSQERPPADIPDGYNFRTPANIDRNATTDPQYAGKYPGLYLNQPLGRRPGDVQYLFISDQPEEARDDRVREDGSKGADGVYARAAFPRAANIRVLMDHTNGTKKPLRMVLLFLAADEGSIAVTQRGEAVNLDSVAAGHQAFVQARRVFPEPRHALQVGQAIPIVDMTMKPGQTAVVHLRCAPSVAGQMVALLTDPSAPLPVSLDDVNKIPVLHSIVWREEAERLKKFIDPKMQPARYERILNSFQHARGTFPNPDRVARVIYDAGAWSDAADPVRVYSLFESIPGIDTTPGTRDPLHPEAPAAQTDNRGKYGGIEELRITIAKLPPNCHRVALLAINPNGTFGGRHYVTDGHATERETWNLPKSKTPGAGVLPLLEHFKASLLWRGNVSPGDVLRMWTEPMANVSVYLWYVVVPIPDAPSAEVPAGDGPPTPKGPP